MATKTYLIVPGYTNSGPDHWQSHLERKYLNVTRVQQDNWQSDLIILSGAGHIHTAAGYGEWIARECLINEISGNGLIPNK
ncbi:alpha/beta hydrolase [Xenorhabdus hominickii]|uniref:Alpha/beta hydrolase n=1 Tax=Xenorhabdus hominickii TaxID=351679 RepID=A0A2G0QF71_XENHO|nr:alpha/beta hydrolase [Xenorhabdus hominickii]AOM41897.1 hypothetical protein A9255_15835 [Xenorhabdus hominickii]PHM57873.1 hypothetical protein Xhom_00876 [Xenorhabdus hominickii]